MSKMCSCICFPVHFLFHCFQWLVRHFAALVSRFNTRFFIKYKTPALAFAQSCSKLACKDGDLFVVSEDVDVNYCIPSKPKESWQEIPRQSFAGYTLLHLVANSSDSFCYNTKSLIGLGADIFRQGVDDRYTALHVAINRKYCDGSYAYKLIGKLFEKPVVNTLLTAQVQRKNPSNPTCKDGVSHFHIACMVNHAKAVEFFAKTGAPRDHATNNDAEYLPGYTAMHFAVRYSSVEAAEILLDRGAKIHLKNADGISPVQLLLQRLMEMNDFINVGERERIRPYQKEKEKLEKIVDLFLKSRGPKESIDCEADFLASDKKFLDETGLSPLHVASTLTNTLAIENLLRWNVSMNFPVGSDCKLWPGWTALHFAACSSIKTFRVLVRRGADLSVKNAKDETPLDLFMQTFSPKIVHSILSMKAEYRDIKLSDGRSKLSDLLLAMNDFKKFSQFAQSLEDINVTVPADSAYWPGHNLLHLAVSMNEKYKTWQEFEAKTGASRAYSESYNCTKAAEKIYRKRVELCLERGCSVSTKNPDGLTPVHLGFRMQKANVVEQLLTHCDENVTDSDGLSHFHIACATGVVEHVKRFVDKGVDINCSTCCSFEWYKNSKSELVRVKANSTPLHIAVTLEHRNVVSYLLERGADVYRVDSLDWTPIHSSIFSSNRDIAKLLLERTPNLQDRVTTENLSHLHVAAYANVEAAVEKLAKDGAQVNLPVTKGINGVSTSFVGKTPLYIAQEENSEKAARVLLKYGADMHLHIASVPSVEPVFFNLSRPIAAPFVDHIKSQKSRDVKAPIDSSGRTLLHLACGMFDLEWAKELVNNGADVNARISGGKCKGDTPLHILVNEAGRVTTAPENILDLVELMTKNGADVTIMSQGKTPVHRISWLLHDYKNTSDHQSSFVLPAVDLMVRSSKTHDNNPTDFESFSHLHYACARNDVEVVRKFLKYGVNVNQMVDAFSPHNAGFTPLHFAVAHRSKEVALLLLKHGANAAAEDTRGNTPFHIAVKARFIEEEVIDALIRCGAPVNSKNIKDKTPLICLVKSKDYTLASLELLLSRGFIMDIGKYVDWDWNGIIGTAMKNALRSDRRAIMRKLCAATEMKYAIKKGYLNAFRVAVKVHHRGRLTVDDYFDVMDQLMEIYSGLGKEPPGFAEIFEAIYSNNNEAVVALLQVGANVNIVDEEDVSWIATSSRFSRKYDDSDDESDADNAVADDEEEQTSDGIAILEHFWKMRFVGLKVSEEADLFQLDEELVKTSDVKSRCEAELKKMETTRICQGLTVKSFLSDKGVKAYGTLSCEQRSLVDKFFYSKADLRREFPEFCGLLLVQYREAAARKKMWKPARDVVVSVCPVDLPELCAEATLQHLTNDELKLLVEPTESSSASNTSG